jgi:hypothetical protein
MWARREGRTSCAQHSVTVMLRRIAFVIAALLLGTLHQIQAATAFSTDGEATIYRTGDFRGDFTLTYAATAVLQPRNRSWSTVSVMLLGDKPPADSISVGLLPDQGGAHIFTSTMRAGKATFRDTMIRCASICVVGLRGIRGGIYAIANGRMINSWPRAAFALPRPAVQLNAEVSGAGDRIEATLEPVQLSAATARLVPPRCAFTTQGIKPTSVGNQLRFRGEYIPGASAAYIDPHTGLHIARCSSYATETTNRDRCR